MKDYIFEKSLKLALDLGWDTKPAKPDGRMNLLTHSLNAMSIADRLISAYEHFKIYKFTENERKQILSALFIHDFSKADEDISAQISAGNIDELPKRLRGRNDVVKCLQELKIEYSEIQKVIDLAISMEYPEPSDLDDFLSSKSVSRKLDRVLKLSDRLAGIRSVEGALSSSVKNLASPLELNIHRVSAIRGISTQLLHKAVQKIAEEKGWFPLLFTTDGTVYIGKGIFEIDEKELIAQLNDELKGYLDSFDYENIGYAAFGSFTSTPIKAPEFVFLSKNSAEGFWEYVRKMNAISNPKDLSSRERKALDALKSEKPEKDFEEYNHLYKLYNSMRYALMMGVSVIKESEKLDENLYGKLIENLKALGIDVNSLLEANLRYNSPFAEVIKGVDEFIERLNFKGTKREEIVSKTIEIFKKATANAVEKSGFEPISIESIRVALKNLISELNFPKISSSVWKDRYEKYLEGKLRGTPICQLCGNKAEVLGVASLIGDGTESFTNMLPGGTTIGGENKVKICFLCNFEAKLRSLIGDAKSSELFYVIPQTSISPNLTELFWSMAKEKLEIGNFAGTSIPSLYEQIVWAEIVQEGKLNEVISKSLAEIIEEAIESAREDKKVRKIVNRVIEDNFGDFESFAEELCRVAGLRIESIDDVISLILKGERRALEYLEIENELKRYRTGVILSNNYVVLLLDKKIGRRGDPETVQVLRKIFIALVISKMFSSTVVISDLPLSVLNVMTPKGAIYTPVKLGLKDFLDPFVKDGWIPFEKMDKLIKKLSAMLLLEDKMIKMGSGNSTLYELTRMSSGEILHRIVQMSGNKIKKESLKRILKLLKEVEN